MEARRSTITAQEQKEVKKGTLSPFPGLFNFRRDLPSINSKLYSPLGRASKYKFERTTRTQSSDFDDVNNNAAVFVSSFSQSGGSLRIEINRERDIPKRAANLEKLNPAQTIL